MMFLNKGKGSDPSSKPAKRSLLGLMFMPNFGDSVRPMGGAFSLFVNLIAMVFAMNGMFPKDHPALTGDKNAKLRLSEILATAWGGLEFTPQGAPKVLLFFAVSSAVVLTVLSFVTAVLLGFASSAHAQSTFTPGPNDLASNWLDLLFNENAYGTAKNNIIAIMGQGGVLPSSSIQGALTRALGLYSNAMLVIAAIMLFYYLAVMVVETAHHGEAMGKRANKIWAPIRMVVAVGLLVPVSSGLNSGQYIVLKVAKMGCGLASALWGEFVDFLVADMQGAGASGGTAGDSLSSVSARQDAESIAYNLLMVHACQYAYNYQIHKAETGFGQFITLPNDYINGQGWNGAQIITGYEGSTTPKKYSFKNNIISDYDLCGSYTIPEAPIPNEAALTALFNNTYNSVIQVFVGGMLPVAANRALDIGNHMPEFDTSEGDTLPPGTASRDDLTDVAAVLQNGITDISRNINASAVVGALATTLGTKSKAMGWVSAGSWFNSLSGAQADLSSIIEQSMPTVSPPQIGKNGGPANAEFEDSWFGRSSFNATTAKTSYMQTVKDLSIYSGLISRGEPSVTAAATSGSTAGESDSDTVGASCSATSPVSCLLWFVGKVAVWTGVWQPNVGASGAAAALNDQHIGVQFHGNNPLLEMAAWGHKCVAAGITFMNAAVWAGMGSSFVGKLVTGSVAVAAAFFTPFTAGTSLILTALGSLVLALGAFATSLLVGFSVVFFTMGIAMAYVVPLLPFLHFFFNTITWAACVAEALVAIPLVALAHINPEGDGISGKATSAYQMIFSIFLRPVMMLFGLICGLLIMYVAVGLLNALFASAVSGAGSASTTGAHMVLGRLLYSVIYVAIVYSIANHATALIGRFPNHAMKWGGMSDMAGEHMGNPSHIAGGVSVATGLATKQALPALANSASKLGGALGSAGSEKLAGAKNAIDKEALDAGEKGKPMPKGGRLLGRDVASQYAKGQANAAQAAETGMFDSAQKGEVDMFKRVKAGASARGMNVNDYVRDTTPAIQNELAGIVGAAVNNKDAFMSNYLAKAHLLS